MVATQASEAPGFEQRTADLRRAAPSGRHAAASSAEVDGCHRDCCKTRGSGYRTPLSAGSKCRSGGGRCRLIDTGCATMLDSCMESSAVVIVDVTATSWKLASMVSTDANAFMTFVPKSVMPSLIMAILVSMVAASSMNLALTSLNPALRY